jgi:hypothetical protein
MNCVLGSVAGNIITITAPKAQITDLKDANRKGIRTRNLTAMLRESSGDDDWSIKFT